jgi:hypothetical protein
MFFNLSIIAALVLAAIAIYRFSRPSKPLVLFHHGGVLSQEAQRRLSVSLKHACDVAGIRGILTEANVTAQPCESHYVVNVNARSLDDAQIKAAVQKSMSTFVQQMKKAQRL